MIEIASGVFGWDAGERRSRRYGAFHLTDSPYSNRPLQRCAVPWYDWSRISPLIGQRVRLQCLVTETRDSEHCGDEFLEVYPSTPTVGEVLDLGVGIFGTMESSYPDISGYFSLRPGDGRKELWIDPGVLYRLHSQTVSLMAEVTTDDFTLAPIYDALQDGVIAVENGFQVRGLDPEEIVKSLPSMELVDLGDGLLVSMPYPKGARLK